MTTSQERNFGGVDQEGPGPGTRDLETRTADSVASDIARDLAETSPPKSIETIQAAAHLAEGVVLDGRIRHRAYEMWEADGRPAGDGHEYWVKAEKEVCAREHRAG